MKAKRFALLSVTLVKPLTGSDILGLIAKLKHYGLREPLLNWLSWVRFGT